MTNEEYEKALEDASDIAKIVDENTLLSEFEQ